MSRRAVLENVITEALDRMPTKPGHISLEAYHRRQATVIQNALEVNRLTRRRKG